MLIFCRLQEDGEVRNVCFVFLNAPLHESLFWEFHVAVLGSFDRALSTARLAKVPVSLCKVDPQFLILAIEVVCEYLYASRGSFNVLRKMKTLCVGPLHFLCGQLIPIVAISLGTTNISSHFIKYYQHHRRLPR